jgi:radical SAM protein with 4Fe4S-binding SPASM domain
MNLIDRFTYLQRKIFTNYSRDFASRFYLLYNRLKCFILYENADMFNFITIELDRNCNRNCLYCPKSVFDDKDDAVFFNKKNFEKTMGQLSKINFRGTILFSGYCEPLMNKNIRKYLSIAIEKLPKVKLVIYTNGDFLSEELMKFFRKNNIFLIITIHEPINSENKLRIEKTVKGYKHAIVKYEIENYHLSTRGNLVKVKKKISKKICIRPSCDLTIDYKGNIVLCNNDFFSKQVFGNLNEKKIMEIWNTKKFKKIRKNLSKRVPNNGICRYCR